MQLRTTFLIGLLLSLLALALAAYLQLVLKLEPCPLCIVQRLIIGCYALICALAIWQHRSRIANILYALLSLLITGSGLALAARHVWLQSLPPDQVPSCGPDLAYMLRNFPLQETVNMLFTGGGECAKVSASLFGLSLAQWTLLYTLLLLALALYSNRCALFPPRRPSSSRT